MTMEPLASSRHDGCRLASSLVLVLAAIMVVVQLGLGVTAIAQDETPFPMRRGDPEIRVYDTAGVLTPSEEESLESDLARARRLGVEMLVYTRISDDSPEDVQQFTDRLRSEWNVATGPDADNGIVYLININPADREANDVYVSRGERALPIRQLDVAEFDRIVNDEMRPQIAEGNFAFAFYYGVRRVLNFAEYSPPDPPALSERQELAGKISAVLAALLAQGTILGYVLIPVLTDRKMGWSMSRRYLIWYCLTFGVLAVVVGMLGIYGRNAFASLVALIVIVWAAAGAPLLAKWLAPEQPVVEPQPGTVKNPLAMGPANG